MMVSDVLVAGAGPAGRALAAELAVRGISVLLVDPHPDRPWQATHTGWLDELTLAPGFDPTRSVRSSSEASVRDRHGELTRLGRTYVVLDPAGASTVLRERADTGDPAGRVVELAGRVGIGDVHQLGERVGVAVDGREHRVRLVVDAAGAGSPLGADGVKPASTARLWQWASGRIGALDPAPPLASPGAGALIMDWAGGRPVAGEPAGIPASFGYVLDLGDGRHLVEETVLAGPRVKGVLPALSARLDRRLATYGTTPGPTAVVEHVAIPLDCAVQGAHGAILPIGVAAGTIHPASGYSVTGSLRTAPPVAAAIARALGSGAAPDRIAAAGSAALWTPRARLAHRLLLRGMRTTSRLTPDALGDFFAAFFALGSRGGAARWAPYLEQPADPIGVAAVMTRMFAALPGPERARLVGRWLAHRG